MGLSSVEVEEEGGAVEDVVDHPVEGRTGSSRSRLWKKGIEENIFSFVSSDLCLLGLPSPFVRP